MKTRTIVEWYPIKITIEKTLEQARETKRITYSKREVEFNGSTTNYQLAGQSGKLVFRTEQELIERLSFFVSRSCIDGFEGFDFIKEEESIVK